MKIKIIGKELKITDAINDYVEKKLDRIDKYFEESEAEVTLRTEKTEQIAEIYVTANGEKYRAVTEDKDMYASIDKDIDILEGQIRKAKTKKEKMMKDASLKTMANSSNKKLVPEAMTALDKFKYEVASEVGVNLKDGYNGDISAKDAGKIGGQMVKKMIEQAERNMK